MGKRLRPKGFSAIEIILVVVFILLLAAVGWYVFAKRTNKSQSSTQTTAQSSNPVLNVPELGIQIPLTDTIKDLEYTLLPTNNADGTTSYNSIGLSSISFDKNSKDKCGASPLGNIDKTLGEYPVQHASQAVYKQLDGFYVTYGEPLGGNCNTDQASLDLQKNQMQAVQQAIKNITKF